MSDFPQLFFRKSAKLTAKMTFSTEPVLWGVVKNGKPKLTLILHNLFKSPSK